MTIYLRKAVRRRLFGLGMALLAAIVLVPKFDLPQLPGSMAFLANVWPGNAMDRSAG